MVFPAEQPPLPSIAPVGVTTTSSKRYPIGCRVSGANVGQHGTLIAGTHQYAIVRTDAGRVEPWAWTEVTPEGYNGEGDAWGATGRPDMTDDYERLCALADLLSNAQHAQIHAGGLLPEIDGNAQVCEAAEREVVRLAAAVWPSAEATVGGAA